MSRRSSESVAGKRRNNGLKDHSGGWQGFVDITLSDEQKQHLAALGEEDRVDCWAFVLRCIEDGYKFSVTIDEKHSCAIATITGKTGQAVNSGFSLSARGPNADAAVLVLYFKHVVLCEEQRWDGHQSEDTNQLSLWG